MRASLITFLSVAEGGRLWNDVCTQTRSLLFCDKSQPIDKRVADYVARVPLDAKAKMMQNGASGYDPLHIPPYQWGSEGLHGPLEPCVCTPDNMTCACPTSFPCPSALGTAFNISLYHMIGQTDGREARAINNLRNHVTQNVYGDGIDYWSPTINMQRDPRWGRNQEVPGEDPMLTGAYAAAFVSGLQGGANEDPEHVQIVACCKHFVANSLESWQGHTRHNFDAHVSKQDLAEYYLPAFRACVMEGKSLGVMCSYNAVNGVPSCANEWLLKDTLRASWRFGGYVTSDCGAIADECNAEPQGHGYAKTCANATAMSIKAGTDVDCGGVYAPGIPKAVGDGALTEAEVDTSFARLTTIQMKLGLFDNDKASQPYFLLGVDQINSAKHKALAYEAAQQSIVLLKNEPTAASDGALLLPLRPGQDIAVLGPHANATEALLSNYHGSRCVDAAKGKGPGTGKDFSCMQSVATALAAANTGGTTSMAAGCANVACVNASGFDAALAVGRAADVIVLAMGIDQSQEAEGHDRVNTTLPGEQATLVKRALALGKPTVLVLISGGALSLGSLKGAAPAIVSALYGGEAGALALADVLFGSYNPSGKLAATMYPPEYVNQLKLTEMSLTAPPGRTHLFYTGAAEFVFGHGLSYTSWSLGWAAPLPPTRLGGWAAAPEAVWASMTAPLHVRIQNVGRRSGRQSVLVLVRFPEAGPREAKGGGALLQKLVAFDGVAALAPGGAAAELSFSLTPSMLARADEDGEMRVAEGAYELVVRDGVNELSHLVQVTA